MANILVVDDDADVRDLISSVLRASDHDVVTCANGVDAVAKAKERDFDVALIDIRMEPIDGVETASRLLDIRPNVRIAMITAIATHTDTHMESMQGLVAAKALGVTRFLTKPFHKEDLLGLIDALLAPEGH